MRTKEEMLREFDERISNWRAFVGASPEDRKFYTEDRKDMRAVYNKIKKKKYAEAYDLARSLDTILRDEIPNDLWEVINDQVNLNDYGF